ncbi:MAG: glycosyltransferase family 1 protein [Planctomycetota bacterium]|nr:MAG: glycosyltransferase family 1 protein [Planctomycetota bacterium]
MMRVGFDIRPALFGHAGIARYGRELARALCELEDGPFLEFYAPTWRGGRVATTGFRAGRYRMHRGLLPARGMALLNRVPGFDAGRWPAPVEVFHWTDYVYPTVRSAATVMTLHDAAFAVDPQFHGWNTSVLLDRVRRAVAAADRVIVVSEPGRHDAELLGVDPAVVTVVPNGVAPCFRPAADHVPGAGDYLLTVGTIEPRKNHSRILQALENLWDRDAAPDWVIVGRTGWECEDFLRRLEASRHRRRIRWLQDTDDEELVRIYQGCIALVYPSLHEGFGLPVLEAMACGKPVVVADGTAPAWVAGAGAMRVQARETDSIQEGIERILGEHPWRRQAAAVLLQRSHRFTWEEAARRTWQVYRQAAEARRERESAAAG